MYCTHTTHTPMNSIAREDILKELKQMKISSGERKLRQFGDNRMTQKKYFKKISV